MQCTQEEENRRAALNTLCDCDAAQQEARGPATTISNPQPWLLLLLPPALRAPVVLLPTKDRAHARAIDTARDSCTHKHQPAPAAAAAAAHWRGPLPPCGLL